MVMWSCLKKRADFVQVSHAGASIATKGVVLQYYKRSCDAPCARVGFTATKRLGNAVIRNRVKRRLRAAAQDVFSSMGDAGYDYVLIGRYTTASRPYHMLIKDIKYALHQVKKA